MKTFRQGNRHGNVRCVIQRWAVKLGGLALGGALLLGVMGPTPANADATKAMTQLEYIKWLVQLSDASSQFSANSTAADYVQWARDNGMNPKDGWKPTATLSRDILAMTLAQFYGIQAKKDTDYARVLEREGIILPTESVVSRAGFVSVIDEFGFQTISAKKAKKNKTVLCPAKHPWQAPKLKSKCTPPKEQVNPPEPPGHGFPIPGHQPKPRGNH